MYQSELLYRNQSVGTVKIETKGLYYYIESGITVPEQGFYRLRYQMNSNTIELGLYLPTLKGYLLERRIAIKNFPIKDGQFILTKDGESESVCFFELRESESFPMLQYLESGRFGFQNGVPGIFFNSFCE